MEEQSNQKLHPLYYGPYRILDKIREVVSTRIARTIANSSYLSCFQAQEVGDGRTVSLDDLAK